MKKLHRAMPTSSDPILRHVVPAFRDPKSDTLNVRSRIVRADEEQPNEKTGNSRSGQDFYLAWMRHHSFEAEATFPLDARVATLVSDDLSLCDASAVRTFKLASDIVGD
jgi:hypothetical protein